MMGLLTLGVALCIMPLVVGGGMLYNGLRNDRRLAARFNALHIQARGSVLTKKKDTIGILVGGLRVISGIGDRFLRLGVLSVKTKEAVESTLRGAGHSGNNALRLFIGAKILLVLTLPGLIWLICDSLEFSFATTVIAVSGAAIGGMVAPDSAVQKLREQHMKKIQDELPDALDMMVICAQAGLGLGITIIRVAHELRLTHRAVAAELAQTASEMQVMTDGKTPLVNLGERCGVDSAKRLASTLLQSTQYGTPLTEALRGLAAELRAEMITRFEAKAARMPVLLTLPMVAFILPSVFLVIGGPAVIQVVHALAN